MERHGRRSAATRAETGKAGQRSWPKSSPRSTSTKPSRPAASMSSTVMPAAMDRVALGKYEASEFDGPMQRCLQAQLVVFSGLKIDKLDDLEAMIARGTIRWVFTAGSLAMALKKAAAELDGKQFSLGVAEDPAHADKPYYIPRERIEQAQANDRRRPQQRH